MTFKTLASYITRIELLSSRLEITKILAELFSKLSPEEFEKTVYLILGRLTPTYKTVNFQMAEKMVIRAVAKAFQIDKTEFVRRYEVVGDIGEVVHKIKLENKSFLSRDIEIIEVYERLLTMAQLGGPGSQEEKIVHLSSLLQEIDPLSARYVIRIPLGILRLGFSDMTVLDSLSWMKQGDKKLRPILQKAFHVHPDLGLIGKVLKKDGISKVNMIEPALFTPIIMMKAERLSSGTEIIEKIGKCSVEPKFDGFRLQVHKMGDAVRLYTRGLDDVTFMYPDVVEGVRKEVDADEAILEGEAIGYDKKENKFLPFQETVQRKRKHGIAAKALEIPLKLFAFELLYLNGKNYIFEPFTKRREELNNIISSSAKIVDSTVLIANDELVDDPQILESIFEDAIGSGLEGIIAKKLDGIYEPGARGWNWIKFKRSYSSKIEDTIDCVVMGYDYGKGKRAEFGIGAFLVGVYDDKTDKFMTIAKIGTGLTDDEWRHLKSISDKLKCTEKPKNYLVDDIMEVDVWINPEIIVEIKADEITRSTMHTAGRQMKPSKSGSSFQVDVPGYALRFPRLERFRSDKTPGESTNVGELISLHKAQK